MFYIHSETLIIIIFKTCLKVILYFDLETIPLFELWKKDFPLDIVMSLFLRDLD